jgi:hypothetical protein
MAEFKDLQSSWNELVGEHLSGVVFARDYLQLQFNHPPQLNFHSSHVVVSTDGRSAKLGEEAFANLALSFIGKFVGEVKVDEQSVRILFADASEILISLRPEHCQGPEVVEFRDRDHPWAILRVCDTD